MSTKDEELASRKQDHIELAFESRVEESAVDTRFYYEPMLSGHPDDLDLSLKFAGQGMTYPIWVSSMTGGTEKAKHINENLARLCGEFGLGMGLGSCRALLDDDMRMSDFDMRPLIGDQPLYANLGIAQIEELIDVKALDKIPALIQKLRADGLIIHVNPLQEWSQPEGDKIKRPPLESIQAVCEKIQTKLIVKEVGQGMGPQSLFELMKLPLAAIEFGASGGTNFTRLELNRSSTEDDYKKSFEFVGHTAEEMVAFANNVIHRPEVMCKEFIVSGGVQNYLHGYYLLQRLEANAIYGQASAFLKNALGSYDDLRLFFLKEIEGLKMAHAYLRLKESHQS